MGTCAGLVVKAAEGTQARYLQRAGRDGDHETVLPRTLQAFPLSDPGVGILQWQDTPAGKQPWYFTARDGSPALTIAGLWDEWRDRSNGETLKSCAMIITEPNAS